MSSTNQSLDQLLEMLDQLQITLQEFRNLNQKTRQLFSAIALHSDLFPESKKIFIDKALVWEKSPNVEDRYKSFLLLSTWLHEKNPIIDAAIDRIDLPNEAFEKKRWWQFWKK